MSEQLTDIILKAYGYTDNDIKNFDEFVQLLMDKMGKTVNTAVLAGNLYPNLSEIGRKSLMDVLKSLPDAE